MKSGLLASACACALLSLPVLAQSPPPRPLVLGHSSNIEAFIAQHDGNADGRLAWAEFETFRQQRFKATDANGDGSVDVEEYVREFEDRMRDEMERGRDDQVEQTRRRFVALDQDKDGQVSRPEFDASGERVWTQGQSVLSGKADAKSQQQKGGDAEAPAARRSNRLALPSSHTAAGFLALYDGNGDGAVLREEFDAARQAQFARTDRNSDGRLSQDEYLAEYEDRLDRHIATQTRGSDSQTRVRFGALDSDNNGRMSFAEYQASGKRSFDAADRNHDGTVDAADAKLPPPPRPERAANARPAGA
ncbi:EF-hand domain-containing protein [Pseudomonas sp. CGJS7]|uniref:EF-hand domain-containing protein n=1 Tax=Pseudomonas sp. CGJS7 TaxID=3109348 RepID=UPI00300867D4